VVARALPGEQLVLRDGRSTTSVSGVEEKGSGGSGRGHGHVEDDELDKKRAGEGC